MSIRTPAQGPRTALANAGDLTGQCAFYKPMPQQAQPNSQTHTCAPHCAQRNTQSKLFSAIKNLETSL